MQYVVEDEPDLRLPEDSIHRARLEEVKPKLISWEENSEKKEKTLLVWWWEITSSNLGAQYVGRKVKGECEAQLTNRDGNRFREWSEALLNRPIPLGMGVETDDLVGLEAEIVIGIRPDKKDPSKLWEFVSGVVPLDGTSGASYDPPF